MLASRRSAESHRRQAKTVVGGEQKHPPETDSLESKLALADEVNRAWHLISRITETVGVDASSG
jgi:hypothetical protein